MMKYFGCGETYLYNLQKEIDQMCVALEKGPHLAGIPQLDTVSPEMMALNYEVLKIVVGTLEKRCDELENRLQILEAPIVRGKPWRK
jgi:hypothetical protein